MIEQTDDPNDLELDRADEVQDRQNDLDPEAAPSRVSVYERPQRRVSPVLLGLLIILLLIAAYFIYQLIV